MLIKLGDRFEENFRGNIQRVWLPIAVLLIGCFLGLEGMPGQCNAGSQGSENAIKKKISTEKQKIQNISQKEARILEALDSMEQKLFRSRQEARHLKKDIESLKTKIQEYSGQRQTLIRELDTNKEYLAQRLKAMYRLNGAKPCGTPDSLLDFLVRRNALQKILQADMTVMETQTKGIARLEEIRSQLSRTAALQRDKQRQLDDRIQKIETDSRKKQALLSRILKEKDLALAALKSLERSAKKLDRTFSSFKEPAQKSQAKGFASCKGKLVTPVSGKILSSFGPSTLESGKGFYFQSGIDISAQRGEPVRSVFKGKVIYAEWLKGYGNLVIINHGNHYYSLYAHVEEIFKNTGESVDTGEIIATIGDTGSITGPCLHFEIRHHGKPVNPSKWLQKGV